MANKLQPYVGPRPFELKDKEIFFGREQEARDLLSLVIAHNVVLVYAQSGAGKTSLLNARLIPMLKENGFEVFPVARVKGIPTEKINNEEIPNIFVFNTIMSWVEGEESIDIKNISQMTLANFLNERNHPIDEADQELPRTIIFDQFEEIFSLLERWKDREGFFSQINDALKDPLLRVVFIMREDYIAQLDPYANLLPEKLRTRFRLERMNREAALLAVKEPLKNTGRFFAEGVAEKLVDEMLKIRIETNPGETTELAGEFVEAVQLQVICQNLWLGLPENVMEINMHYLDTFGNVEKALSQFYDEALRVAVTIFPIDEERLRQWFEEMLITSMGTRSTVYRAPESTGGIPNEVIDFLEGRHLIRAEIRAGARWYELTHDRFIEPILLSNKYYRSKDTNSREKEDASRRANQAIKKGEQAWGDKNYEEALKWFEEALANYEGINGFNGIVNTYLNIGNIYFEMKNYELAIEKFQKVIEIDPKYVYAYSKWGSALSKLKRYDEAIEKFQKAIEIDPNYAFSWYNKACVLSLTNGDSLEISKYLAKAIKLDPKLIKMAEKDLDFESVKNRQWFKNILSETMEADINIQGFIDEALKFKKKEWLFKQAAMGSSDEMDKFGTPKIVVVGCGGGGNNTVNRLYNIGVSGADTIAINTDKIHLDIIQSDKKILIGKSITRGLGAGGFPEVGRRAAELARGTLEDVLKDANLVFVTAGMGGGTGTGVAPVVAQVAKDQGAIVIGMVTSPFKVERSRMFKAEEGLDELRKAADTVIVLDLNKMLEYGPNLPIDQAFSVMDQLISETVKSITEAITQPSLINLDYADVMAIMKGGGLAVMLVGEAKGQDKAKEVVRSALNHPLLDMDTKGATGCLLIITGGTDMSLNEAEQIASSLTYDLDSHANVIWGARAKKEYNGKMRCMAIITGIHSAQIMGPKADSIPVRNSASSVEHTILKCSDRKLKKDSM